MYVSLTARVILAKGTLTVHPVMQLASVGSSQYPTAKLHEGHKSPWAELNVAGSSHPAKQTPAHLLDRRGFAEARVR